ncbi:hypothetical protein ACYRFT_01710 [Listeria kieliensis]
MKKIRLLVMAGLLLLVISGSITAFAKGNTADTRWHNEYRFWSPYDHSPARMKFNTSAYYNKVTGSSLNNYAKFWAALGDGKDVSDGHVYRQRLGNKPLHLYNKALEWNNYYPIKVRVESARFESFAMWGVWSPDSRR